jgi:D-sedoheptulose 7-phosphate isomerase
MKTLDTTSIFTRHLDGHFTAVQALREQGQIIQQMADAWISALAAGKKILFFGNGGSAADAQHLAAELCVRYRINRRALAGLALTTDTSVLTAHSNNFGFETVFARQVEAIAQPGDVVIGISTSGTSPNIIAGLCAANDRGCTSIAFTGRAGADCARVAHLSFRAPSDVTAHVQECHLLVGHVLCEAVETAVSAER